MSDLRAVRKELANAISTAGWTTYMDLPSSVRFPFCLIEPGTVTYDLTKGGRMTVTYVLFICQAINHKSATEYIDAAISYDTPNSIPSALKAYTYETINQLKVNTANEFATYNPTGNAEAYGCKLEIEIITS